ncbi:unnamed protein product [Fraxinus pennsylvanica]|uniref:Uncharacterized protein n=1 Tax=Fraxinus pennsylvanica TaxID=56036 RepID=A0AAD2AKM2_9LAMI|nr:unnamed protein product [Fraxinus pennsylvanica]
MLLWGRNSVRRNHATAIRDFDSRIAAEDFGHKDKLGFRVDLERNTQEDEDQVALKLQSQVMVALPSLQDIVQIELRESRKTGKSNSEGGVIDCRGHLANGMG